MGSRSAAMVASFLLVASAAAARAEVVVDVQAGFGGVRPLHGPAPLGVRLENRTSAPLRARLSVRDGGGLVPSESSVVRDLEVSPGATRQATLLLPAEFTAPMLSITSAEKQTWDVPAREDGSGRAVAEQRRSVEVPFALSVASGETMVVLGARARQLTTALAPPADRVLSFDASLCAVVPADESWAPDTWLAYEGVSTVVWLEPDPSRLPDPAQLRALDDHVRFGGTLVVLSAGRPERLEHPAVASLLPGSVKGVDHWEYPAPPGFDAGTFGGSFPVLDVLPRGRALAVEGTGPAWITPLPPPLRARLGRGEVRVGRFDPLRYDLGDPIVFGQALAQASGARVDFVQPGSIDDLGGAGAGWLAGGTFFSLLANENVLTPPLGLFVLLGLVFVLVVGPLDYVLLKRLRRLHWSPWTLLAYTLLFSGASIGSTYFLFAPDEQLNRLAIVDLDEGEQGDERMSGWLYRGIYAPYGGECRVGLPGGQVFGALAAEHTEDVFRGLTVSGPTIATGRWAWEGPGAQPLLLQSPFNSLRVVAQRFSGRPVGTVDGEIEASPDGGFVVRVRNGLPSRLRRVAFVTSKGVLPLPGVAPGSTVERAIASLEVRPEGPVEPLSTLGDWSFFWNGHAVDRRHAESPVEAVSNALTLSTIAPAGGVKSPTGQQRLARLRFGDREETPWFIDPDLLRDHALLVAYTDALPFDDGLGEVPAGFTDVLVRRLVELPKGLR